MSTAGPGLAAGLVRVNDRGTYAFVDVKIDPHATPGPRTIILVTAAGGAAVPLELLAPLPREGRFQGFSSDDVIYLIMPDRFANGDPSNDDPAMSPGLFDRTKARYYHGGDLQGIVDRLPYLKDLGVTALWLNPWYDNVNHLNERETYDGQPITDYHGYGAVDFYGVEEHFGDLATLRELVDKAHAAGIKVIQDQVANHTGPYHPWVKDPPTPTWFNGTQERHLANTWQTWTLIDPHATPEVQKATLEGWFVDILPDLNQDDAEVARYVIQNTLWWVGVTGLDGDPPGHAALRAPPLLARLDGRDQARVPERHAWSASCSTATRRWSSFFQGGATRFDGIDSGIDTLFDFPLYFAIRERVRPRRTMREVARDARAATTSTATRRVLVTLLGLHDVPRFMNEPGATPEALKLAFTFLLTARGIPLVYYGDEIAMPGGGDPDNRRDFPGGFPGDARNAFEASGRTPDEQAVHAHVRALLRLRADTPALRRGATRNLHVAEQVVGLRARLEGAEPGARGVQHAATGPRRWTWTSRRSASRAGRG